MPSLSELPDKINFKSFLKALEKLGFEISTKGGKGSHVKATYKKNHKCVTIQRNINKNVLYYILKQIEVISDVTWEDIKQKL